MRRHKTYIIALQQTYHDAAQNTDDLATQPTMPLVLQHGYRWREFVFVHGFDVGILVWTRRGRQKVVYSALSGRVPRRTSSEVRLCMHQRFFTYCRLNFRVFVLLLDSDLATARRSEFEQPVLHRVGARRMQQTAADTDEVKETEQNSAILRKIFFW